MKAKLFGFLIASVLLVACGGGGGDPKQVSVAMWGDSTMYGAATHKPPYDCTRASPTISETVSAVTGFAVVNNGVNGSRAPDALSGAWHDPGCKIPTPPSLSRFIADNPNVDIHAFAFGINDSWTYGLPDYTDHIKQVHAAGKIAVLIEPFQVEPTAPTWDASYLPRDHMDRVIAVRKSLLKYGVPVISVSELDTKTVGENAPDGLHPSQQYADKLGRLIASQMIPISASIR